jgi:uncharacterized paraquat-inducible protein A
MVKHEQMPVSAQWTDLTSAQRSNARCLRCSVARSASGMNRLEWLLAHVGPYVESVDP